MGFSLIVRRSAYALQPLAKQLAIKEVIMRKEKYFAYLSAFLIFGFSAAAADLPPPHKRLSDPGGNPMSKERVAWLITSAACGGIAGACLGAAAGALPAVGLGLAFPALYEYPDETWEVIGHIAWKLGLFAGISGGFIEGGKLGLFAGSLMGGECYRAFVTPKKKPVKKPDPIDKRKVFL